MLVTGCEQADNKVKIDEKTYSIHIILHIEHIDILRTYTNQSLQPQA